ncbi:MAG: glycosyltransferase [Acidobacteriota bacterium]
MDPVCGLWIGSELSTMERLSITSYLANGHPYHLYAYRDIAGVPEGTVMEDANRILPESSIFKYRHHDSYAGFSNYFRYKLLLEKGGWWSDLDVVCLRPFDFGGDYVFPAEMSDAGTEVAANCVMRTPQGSAIMRFAWDECRWRDPGTLLWGETGPILMQEAIERFGLRRFRHPYRTFCPITHQRWQRLVEPDADLPGGVDVYAIHLWNELWRRSGTDKNARYASTSIYERLKRRYLSENQSRDASPEPRINRENHECRVGLSEADGS